MDNIVALTVYGMTTLEKFVNKKALLISAIVGVGILLSAGIFTASPIGNLWAQQQMITKNASMYDNIPKINGSVNVGQQIKNFFKEGMKIPFTTATETAQKQITNGTVLGGHLGVTQGYLTYTYFVVNPINGTGYKVIVDAGNGKVLYTSEGLPMASLASSWKGHGSWHGFEGSWEGHGPGGFWHGLFGS
jgi:uncharacterized membrane protein YkoI